MARRYGRMAMKYYKTGEHLAHWYSFMLLSIGLYADSLDSSRMLPPIIATNGLAVSTGVDLVIGAINAFYTEDYHTVNRLTTLCAQSNISYFGVISGLGLYSHFVLGNIERANQLMDQFLSTGDINSINQYCAFKLKHKRFDRFIAEWVREAGCYHMNQDGHAVTMLFTAMILEEAPSNRITTAIQAYHRCNFFAVHPIHFWKLSQCYLKVRLYRRALKYLKRAYHAAEGQVPSINRDYDEQETVLRRTLKLLRCDRRWSLAVESATLI